MTVEWIYRGRGICDDCDGGGGFTGVSCAEIAGRKRPGFAR